MAKPPRIEKLRHGRLLSGKVFRFFVETWNWLVGAFDNMRGDADINPAQGSISIDRTDPDNPVIRFVGKAQNINIGAIDEKESNYPFKVRVLNFNQDEGTWQLQIYLPACADILVYRDSDVDPCYSDDLEYPEGAEGYWYNVLCDSTDGTLYLKIVKDDEGYNKVSYSFDYGTGGDGVVGIAYISSVYNDDGALQSVSVEQYVRSALHLGGESGWKDPDPGYFDTEE